MAFTPVCGNHIYRQLLRYHQSVPRLVILDQDNGKEGSLLGQTFSTIRLLVRAPWGAPVSERSYRFAKQITTGIDTLVADRAVPFASQQYPR